MHARALAERTPQAERVEGEIAEVLPRLLAQDEPVHLHFTDRVFGRDAREAADVVERVAAVRPVSVTLHDVPQPSDGHAFTARAAGYARVVAAARRVIVSSDVERDLVIRHTGVPADTPIHVAPLPIDRIPLLPRTGRAPGFPTAVPTVGLLGFIYPGKGHEQVLSALASGSQAADVVALGRPSDGHHDLVAGLERTARARGRALHVTGFLSEEQLTTAARAVTVPVVAPTHVSASGSVGRWIASGRRPIVTRHPYFEELHRRAPWALTLTDDLASALTTALHKPASTHIDEREWNDVDVPSTARAARNQWALLTGQETTAVTASVPGASSYAGVAR